MKIMLDSMGVVKLQLRAQSAMRQGAYSGVTKLRERLSDTFGSGRSYRGLPNPSSAPDEYPTRQSGHLLDTIGMQLVSEGNYQVGLINATQAMYKLEFEPPSEGGRAPINKAFNDADIRAAILEGVRNG